MSGTGLKWGVAGYGDIVRKKALPALLTLGETVTRVWGRDAARARAICREFGAGSGTDDYQELLETADVVYVATPVAAHLPLAVAAVRAGRPVLVEKPLTGALAAAGAAELDGGHVGVAYYRRLAPAVRRARELLAGRAVERVGRIGQVERVGRVERVTVEYRGHFDPAPGDPKTWRTDPALSGGGVLADVGSHRLDLLCLLLGEPAVTEARTGLRFPRGAERVARARLAWPSGTHGELDAQWRPGPSRDRLRLDLDGGWLELDPLDSGYVRGTVGGEMIEEFLPPPPNPHVPLMADFARSVRDGTDPVCPVAAARAVDRLISAVYAAATTLEEDTSWLT